MVMFFTWDTITGLSVTELSPVISAFCWLAQRAQSRVIKTHMFDKNIQHNVQSFFSASVKAAGAMGCTSFEQMLPKYSFYEKILYQKLQGVNDPRCMNFFSCRSCSRLNANNGHNRNHNLTQNAQPCVHCINYKDTLRCTLIFFVTK